MVTVLRKAIPMVVIAAIVLGAAGFSFAGGWRPGPGGCLAELDLQARVKAIQALGLTEDQVDEIQTALRESFEQRASLRQRMSEMMLEFQSLLWQQDPDQQGLEARWQQFNEVREQLRELKHAHERIRGVLTEEQRKSLHQQNMWGGLKGRMHGGRMSAGGKAGSGSTR